MQGARQRLPMVLKTWWSFPATVADPFEIIWDAQPCYRNGCAVSGKLWWESYQALCRCTQFRYFLLKHADGLAGGKKYVDEERKKREKLGEVYRCAISVSFLLPPKKGRQPTQRASRTSFFLPRTFLEGLQRKRESTEAFARKERTARFQILFLRFDRDIF